MSSEIEVMLITLFKLIIGNLGSVKGIHHRGDWSESVPWTNIFWTLIPLNCCASQNIIIQKFHPFTILTMLYFAISSEIYQIYGVRS